MENRLWDVHVLVHFQEDCEVNKTDKAVEKVSARMFFYSLFFSFKLETLDHFKMLGRSISLWPSLKKKKKGLNFQKTDERIWVVSKYDTLWSTDLLLLLLLLLFV